MGMGLVVAIANCCDKIVLFSGDETSKLLDNPSNPSSRRDEDDEEDAPYYSYQNTAQPPFSSPGRRSRRKFSLQGQDITPKKVEQIPQISPALPLDCIGEVLSFCASSGIFFSLLTSSKNVKEFFQETNPTAARNIQFIFTHSHFFKPSQKKILYVFNLKFHLVEHFRESSVMKYFPNVRALSVWQCSDTIKGDTFAKYFKNMSKIEIADNYSISDTVFVRLKDQIEHVDINNCTKISDVGLCMLNKLQTLKITRGNEHITQLGFSSLPNLKSLSLSAMSFGSLKVRDTSLRKLVELRLEYFKDLSDEVFLNLLNLEKLVIAYCDNITGKNFKQLLSLTVLKIYWCDHIENEEIFPGEILERICLKGVPEFSGVQFRNCMKLRRLTLVEMNMINDEVLGKLTKLERIKLINCNSITPKAFNAMNKLRMVTVRGCDNIDRDYWTNRKRKLG